MTDQRLTLFERFRAAWVTTAAGSRLVARTVVPPLRVSPIGQSLSGPARLDHGLILLLPGIGGESFMTHDVAAGFDAAGLPDAIEVFPWASSRIPIVGNLVTYAQNRRHAACAAERIRRYQQEYPGRAVHLFGYSGGAGEAVMILENLDEAVPATGALLVGAALSPDYNLAPALRRTTHGIHNFHNPRDRTLLGLAMLVLGTLDRRRCLAAGMVGFRPSEGISSADADLYRTKLHQVRWSREMMRDGHPGGHAGWTDCRFVRQWLAPIIARRKLGKGADF